MSTKFLFIIGLLFVATPMSSPPIALALGLAFGMIFAHPFPAIADKLSKLLLQVSVVGLGFGMNLNEVISVGRSGLLYTFLSISLVMLGGLALGRVLSVNATNGFLIAVGTAICGGSAIAAVGPVLEASNEEMSISLATVFILNSAALILFPMIGRAVGLTQQQFGLWAALAIHDTSSVVGAGMKYGAVALAVATTVKLARSLWIAPVALAAAIGRHPKARIKWPWFILYFVAATAISTYLPAGAFLYGRITALARIGLVVTLYLIGTNISRATLRTVGLRPLLQGLLLWIVVTAVSLGLVHADIIAL